MDDYFQEKTRRIISSIRWVVAIFVVILIVLLVFVRIEETITTQGIVTFEKSFKIYSPTDGFVSQLVKREGEMVEKDEIILSLDDRDVQQQRKSVVNQIEEAKANLAVMNAKLEEAKISPMSEGHRFAENTVKEAEAKVSFASTEYVRRRDLLKRGVESESNVERAKMEADLAKQSLDRAQKQMGEVSQGLEGQVLQEAQAQQNAAKARLRRLEQELVEMDKSSALLAIRAPASGRISHLSKREPGEPVKRGELLAHVGAGEINRVLLDAEDYKAHRVKKGQQVRLKSSQINALLEGYVRGTITEVGIEKNRSDSEDTQERTLEIEAHVDSTPVDLVPGTQVTGLIVLGHKPLWRVILGLDH